MLETIDVQLPGRPRKDSLQYRPHAVELKFAVTVGKVQGKTCVKVILQLNKRNFMPYLTFHMLIVELSRVKKGDDIRLVPPQPGNASLDYLAQLKPSEDLLTWLEAFDDDDGMGAPWNIAKACEIHKEKQNDPATKDKASGTIHTIYPYKTQYNSHKICIINSCIVKPSEICHLLLFCFVGAKKRSSTRLPVATREEEPALAQSDGRSSTKRPASVSTAVEEEPVAGPSSDTNSRLSPAKRPRQI